MSDALNYLIKTRPETISHYFAFLKQTGTHLDPKTRNLISVITKVYSQTDRGFRQYLGRALREGCTPMEVLDALLMAFPALGLAKITWAVDIMLDMNVPGFDPDVINQKTPAQAEWRDVMADERDRQKVIQFDRELRKRDPHVWLTDEAVQIEQANFDDSNEVLFGRETGACYSGMCFV